MKLTLSVSLLLLSIKLTGQTCGCDKKTFLNDIIDCSPTIFRNGAKLYRQYDCKSSSIIFQYGKIKKKIFELDAQLMELTGKLGYSDWTEYKQSFLIENRVASGCCQPSEFILFDKNSGRIIKELGSKIFLDNSRPIAKFLLTLKDFNTILYTNLMTNRIREVKLPKGLFEKSLLSSNELFAQDLIQKITLHPSRITINYRFKDKINSDWKTATLTIKIQ